MSVPLPDEGVPIYDDEPENQRELDAHPEREAILEPWRVRVRRCSSSWIWTLVSYCIVRGRGTRGLFARRQDLAIEIELQAQVCYFTDDWMRAVSEVEGSPEVDGPWGVFITAGSDTVWNTFSPTVGFKAIRTMIAVLCNLKYHTSSYDLSGASLGTPDAR